ncbi:hypothetical protein HMPREF9372_0956 [Sporosarcina newyorkensis 2681]|uniref:Uncharacterized protein n=1 Tax=Sporosarcina newyorkensis 2681 TaxID=1027292 RepID=F9DQ76_9BACL|nr:DUF3226 domain-containing protein [Sporosarcina newyorkensis]EGQ27034.1 hypothetical protein HMPREF9372_0956 [Sporosarcina newyorkensis 2681]
MLEHLIGNIDKEFLELVKGAKFDEVKSIPKKFGIFVFPNNEESGTLELLLLEGGELVYADLLVGARSYLEDVSEIHKRNWTVSDADKVLFGVAANVLKPGKANQVSIQDNQWISDQTIESTSQIRLLKFLEDILR